MLRHKGNSSITIDRNIEEVFPAVVMAGGQVGKIKEKSKMANYIVFRSKYKIWPPQNAATVRITLKNVSESQTEINFDSDAFDGLVGFGSAGKAIDQLIKSMESELT